MIGQRIEAISASLSHDIAAVAPNLVFSTPSRISRTFPTIKIQISDSNDNLYDIEALLDSGATSTYISQNFVRDNGIPSRKLVHPVYAWNADDTLNATAITHKVKITSLIQGHSSTEWFYVTDIGTKVMVIGMTWLRSHNPVIDWRTGKIAFSRCPPSCLGGGSRIACLHSLLEDASTATEYPTSEQIFAIHHAIRAKEHASTRWAIEDYKTRVVPTIEDIRAGPFADFVDVFEEANYQELPLHTKWDHKIDLIPRWESLQWKSQTYPLTYNEQQELDQFLKENLANGCICPSDSPLVSPVFFTLGAKGVLPNGEMVSSL